MSSKAASTQDAVDFAAFLYINAAALTILVYDSALTFSTEVNLIWKKKFRLAAGLYCMARYPGIICYLGYIVANNVVLSTKATNDLRREYVVLVLTACTDLAHFLDTLTLVPLIGIQGLVIARTYAISRHNIWVLTGLSLLLLGSLIPFIIIISSGSCDVSTDKLKTIKLESNIGSSMIMATDSAFIILTIYYTIGFSKPQREALKGTVTGLLLEQGVLRYLFVLTFNVTGIVVQATTRPSIGNNLAPIRNVLSTIIMCRFLLDIRRRNERVDNAPHPPSLTTFHAASWNFKNIVMEEFGDTSSSSHIKDDTPEENDLQEFHKNQSGLDPASRTDGTYLEA